MSRARQLWYVAYGSNTASAGLARYLPRVPDAALTRWVAVPHALHFAGYSHRWEGGVAFLSLPPPPPAAAARGRAYPVTLADLFRIAEAENAQAPVGGLPDPGSIAVGGWVALPLPPSDDSRRGKYDALLRLPDIDGVPAVTLTTTRDLPRRPPGAAYLAACRAGLAEDPDLPDVDAYLAAACRRSGVS